jgi:hypothetical protein
MNARSLKTAGTTAVALLGLAATSYGYLGATGSGTGSGNVNVADRQLVISGVPDTDSTLLPTGETHGRLKVNLRNATTSSLRAESLVLDTSRGTHAGYDSEANRCKVTLAQSITGPWTIAAGTNRDIVIENAVQMGTEAPSDCQGKRFTIYLKVA